MWIMTPRGFFSVVHKDGSPDEVLTVRARARQDLEGLGDLLPVEPYALQYSDYPWRIEVTRDEWTYCLAMMAAEIDYGNFKNEVTKRQGPERSAVYSRVWGALLALEPREAKAGTGTATTATLPGAWDYPARAGKRKLKP